MYKRLVIFGCILSLTFLYGCSNNIVDEAKRIEEEEQQREIDEETVDKKQKMEQQELLLKEGSSIAEVKEKINKQKEIKKTLPKKDIDDKESFTDPEEFSHFISRIFYNFEAKEIDSEAYYNFLIKHGSRVLLIDIDVSQKEELIEGYESLQELINQDSNYIDHKISELTTDETGIYAYFYRTVKTEDGETNYVTTIVKEGGKWKFDSDVLSSGYNEK